MLLCIDREKYWRFKLPLIVFLILGSLSHMDQQIDLSLHRSTINSTIFSHSDKLLGNKSLPSPQANGPHSYLSCELIIKMYTFCLCLWLAQGTRSETCWTRSDNWGRQGESGSTAGAEDQGSTEEVRQKEILTEPRYTHKSPDTTCLLSVFYRAALWWRNSVTAQFLQRKIWSLSTFPPLTSLSLLFSVYPTWYHSVTSLQWALFSIILPPPISTLDVPALLLVLYIPPVMFHSPISIHLHVALLIPSHLLPSAPVHFPFSLSWSRLCVPSHFHPLFLFPSFCLIHFLSAIYSIHSFSSICATEHHHPSLPYGSVISSSHCSSLYFLWPPCEVSC